MKTMKFNFHKKNHSLTMTTNHDRGKNHGLAINPTAQEHTEVYNCADDHGLAMTVDYGCDKDHSLAVKVSAVPNLLFTSDNSNYCCDGGHSPAVIQDHYCDNSHDLPVISFVKFS